MQDNAHPAFLVSQVPDASVEVARPILPPGDPAWLASHVEDILDPERPIIDAHHHLWGEPRRPYLAADYADDLASGHNIVSTVYVDCSFGYRTDGPEDYRSVGETEFAAGVAVRSLQGEFGGVRMCEGVVSRVDLGIGAGAQAILHAHVQAGAGRFKGIRFSSAWDPDPEIRSTARQPPPRLLYDPKVREGAAAMVPLGLVLDTWVYHHQLEDVAAFAEALPELTIVLDHAGGPVRIGRYRDGLGEMYALWRRYAASKSALSGIVRTLALELGGDGITVNVVAPGPVRTEMFETFNPPGSHVRRQLVGALPVGFVGEPEDVAHAVSFFVSDQARFVTGQTLLTCGGASVAFVDAEGREVSHRFAERFPQAS